MIFGITLSLLGASMVIGAARLSAGLKAPNENVGAPGPSRLSFIMVGVGFIIVGVASMIGWA